ncbi:hypothetical protein Tco_0183224 [Tanacetum coccineum]
MALPNEHQLKFSSYKDAKTLMQAIESRFGGNTATKKTQKQLLKQQDENFAASSIEVIEQTYERLQKLISQLEMHEIETLSLDDLFNNLKAYESEVKGTSNSTLNSTNNIAMLTMRAKRFLKNTGRKLDMTISRIGLTRSKCSQCDGFGYDWSDQAEEDDFVDVNESVSEPIVEKPTVETNEPKTSRKENRALIIE